MHTIHNFFFGHPVTLNMMIIGADAAITATPYTDIRYLDQSPQMNLLAYIRNASFVRLIPENFQFLVVIFT
jgi:hypothetical protein